MKQIFACVLVAASLASHLVAAERAVAGGVNNVDSFVFQKLKELGIEPSERCTDAVFLRRVYLDVTGRLPTLEEADRFLESDNPRKRELLIDRLLESEAYADYLAMKWCDILRVKSEFPSKLWPNGVQAYYRWIHTALRENMPYDEFARSLLLSSGSNFRVPEVNFFRAVPEKTPHGIATAVALTFMGARTKHWTDVQRNGMAAFFGQVGYKGTSEWKEEIVYHDVSAEFSDPATKKPYVPIFPNGQMAEIPRGTDPREVFTEWLTAPENPWFAMNGVNRVWYWLMGRGLIHEPDDIRPDNPPQNEKLLAWLEKEFVNNGYDLKHVFRLILNSRAYQLSSVTTEENKSDDTNFSHCYVRQLEAEVLIDAINRLTATTEQYHSRVPEPFTFIPPKSPSVTLADGSISSPFLEMFGRPPRDTGLESERNNAPSANQRLHMLNSTHIQNKIRNSWRVKSLIKAKGSDKELAKKLYMAVLSRPPSANELAVAAEYMDGSGLKKQDAIVDLIWALMNTKEFFCRH